MMVRRGFTLVEILIVVTILGVMAAIVVPQFSSAADESKRTALVRNLQTVRKQIELYRHHHNGEIPAADGEAGADFERRMTTQTDIDGAVGGDFGPYLERLPANSFNSLDTVRVGGEMAGANSHGWRFDPVTGEFQADDDFDGDDDGAADHVTL